VSERISILAGRRLPRPDMLKQTDQPPISTKPLQTGRALRFNKILRFRRFQTPPGRAGLRKHRSSEDAWRTGQVRP
jgi:hypothetical protein